MLRRGSRFRAFLIVTSLSIGAGAAFGGLVVAGVMVGAQFWNRSLTMRDVASLIAIGAMWGAMFGFALGPLTAFGLLRAVPLWRSILGTAVGSLLGIGAAFVFVGTPFVTIPVGFVAGALFVRLRHGGRKISTQSTSAALPPDAGESGV